MCALFMLFPHVGVENLLRQNRSESAWEAGRGMHTAVQHEASSQADRDA